MKAGNKKYENSNDLPDQLALFPLYGALLLPSGYLPLNIFEPRYLEMINDAMQQNHLIGIIQPLESDKNKSRPDLQKIGCIGRISSYTEMGDGRIFIGLQGICRFTLQQEIETTKPYRSAYISPFLNDLTPQHQTDNVDRKLLLKTFDEFLTANELQTNWDNILKAPTEQLVNALSMSAPFGASEKQALLEAANILERSQTLIALTELSLMLKQGQEGSLN